MILNVLLSIPVISSLIISFIPRNDQKSAKLVALWGGFSAFIVSCFIAGCMNKTHLYQFTYNTSWFCHISYHIGIDRLSLPFVLLTTFLSFLCLLYQPLVEKGFFIAFLCLETLILGCFLAIDLVLFYIFFETVIIPLFFIIGIWGGENRLHACYKFFLFTFAGSLCFLISILVLYHKIGTFDLSCISSFNHLHLPWVWLGIFFSMAIKIPTWPFHIWLPETHVQAPTTGSVMLAGVLLKLGGYGVIRILWDKWHVLTIKFTPLLHSLGAISLIYASLLAFAQKDLKKAIAFSSVAHMGYVLIGIGSGTKNGIHGALIQMISHGLISAGLFFVVGMISERFNTYDIKSLHSLKTSLPRLSSLFFLILLGSIAVPGTSGFVGEFLIVLGNAHSFFLWSCVAAFGIVLTAVYMLAIYQKIFLGTPHGSSLKVKDTNKQETFILVAIISFIIFLGVCPIQLR